METLGSFLKKARELKNMSQEDLAKITCYHVSRIQALEENRHENLPPTPYVKGMLRSISKYLGLDVQEVLRYYEDFLSAQPKSVAPVPLANEMSETPFYLQKNFLLVSATVSFVVLVIIVSFLFREPKQVKPIGDISTTETTSASEVSLGAKESVAPLGGYKLVIQAPKDIWLKVQMDSDAPYPLPLKAGGSTELHAKRVLRFFISDAEGVKFTLNDKEMSHSFMGAKTFVFPSKLETTAKEK